MRIWFAAFVLFACLSGCQGKKYGTVKGQVLHKGQPLTEGNINFHSAAKGAGAIAKIGADGQYAFPDSLEVGDYAVFVTPAPPTAGDPRKGPTKFTPSKIPQKARDMNTSGITATVKEGPNEIPIEIKN